MRSMGGQPAPFLFKKTQGRQKGFASTPGKAAQRSTRAGGAKAREVTGLAVQSPKASPTARAAQPLRYGAFSVLPRTSHWPPIRTGRPKTQTAVSPNPADPEHCHPTALPPHSTATPQHCHPRSAPARPNRRGRGTARSTAPHRTLLLGVCGRARRASAAGSPPKDEGAQEKSSGTARGAAGERGRASEPRWAAALRAGGLARGAAGPGAAAGAIPAGRPEQNRAEVSGAPPGPPPATPHPAPGRGTPRPPGRAAPLPPATRPAPTRPVLVSAAARSRAQSSGSREPAAARPRRRLGAMAARRGSGQRSGPAARAATARGRRNWEAAAAATPLPPSGRAGPRGARRGEAGQGSGRFSGSGRVRAVPAHPRAAVERLTAAPGSRAAPRL